MCVQHMAVNLLHWQVHMFQRCKKFYSSSTSTSTSTSILVFFGSFFSIFLYLLSTDMQQSGSECVRVEIIVCAANDPKNTANHTHEYNKF